ncbi:MAG: prohibitin family protein [Dehalococcoidales bacterium]|mgnify:CR=1 FL=1|jgi:regulator of protease activity HflC (stomatin/prohibitin superfamily)|nr:prohibitin family protein [Dehalococcoidales bacterium]
MKKFNRPGIIIAAVIILLLLVIGGFKSIFTVPAGVVGVRFDPFGGGISERQYTEGLHIKAPWVTIYGYNAKTQVFTMAGSDESSTDITHGSSVQNVTNEGLYITLDLSVQYKIDPTKAWSIRQNIGEDGDYQQIVVLPQIRSTLRDVVSQHSAAEIYGEGKAIVESEIYADLSAKLAQYNIIVESVLLRNVVLPDQLVESIELKKAAEQEALRMEYVLQTSEYEAQRKVIEAQGIADANGIIANSITEAYLYWYWIEMLKSNPSTIYVVPSDGSGLPIFTLPLDKTE